MANFTSIDLPKPIFTKKDRRGYKTTLKTDPINAFSISPSGRYIAGTTLVADGAKKYARYWVLRRDARASMIAGGFAYVLEPQDSVPNGWYGLSGRAINDNRDIVGFYHTSAPTDGTDNANIPMKKLGEWALPTPMFDYETRGAAFGISNAREASGYFAATGNGFRAVPSSLFSHGFEIKEYFHDTEPRGTNIHGDLIYQKEVDGLSKPFAYLKPENRHVDLSNNSIFGNAIRIVVNGLNDSRQVVGFFQKEILPVSTPAKLRTYGFHGLVSQSGLIFAEKIVHPKDTAAVESTFLYGISNGGHIVGTFARVNPFLLHEA